jgi:hypothetical protein
LGLLVFVLLNEAIAFFLADTVQLIVLSVLSVLLTLLVVFKDEQMNERARQIELSFHTVNLLALVLVNVASFTSQSISLLSFFFLAAFAVVAVLQIRMRSLRFELENINKWPTADVILRYTKTLRHYLARKDEYAFRVYIHGYMEMHRQKCDNPRCPSRVTHTEAEKRLFERGVFAFGDEQVFRCQNLVKFIYAEG